MGGWNKERGGKGFGNLGGDGGDWERDDYGKGMDLLMESYLWRRNGIFREKHGFGLEEVVRWGGMSES